jgi:hypothetical protein
MTSLASSCLASCIANRVAYHPGKDQFRCSKVFLFEVNYLGLSDPDAALLIVNICLDNAEFSACSGNNSDLHLLSV